MSGVDTAYAAGFVDSDVARVNSPPFLVVPHFEIGAASQISAVMDQSHRILQSTARQPMGPGSWIRRLRPAALPDCPFANRSPGRFWLFLQPINSQCSNC
jgi:hypothetical protein